MRMAGDVWAVVVTPVFTGVPYPPPEEANCTHHVDVDPLTVE